jgi:cytochrome c oxidase subunit 1
MLISIPTGSKCFNWLCTYCVRYLIIFSCLLLVYLKLFLIMFTLGGSSGLMLGNTCLDISLHDSYYVVSHFHIVLSLGTILSMFSGLIVYVELLLCFVNVCILCVYLLYVLMLGILLTVVCLHYVGFNVVPRRMCDFVESVNCWHCVSSVGCLLTCVCIFVLLTNPRIKN